MLSLSALVSLCAGGCGGGGKAGTQPVSSTFTAEVRTETDVTTHTIPPGQPFRGDGDADNPGDIDGNGDIDPSRDRDNDYPTRNSYKFPDADDSATFAYGHRPRPSEERTIANVVKRYYTDGVSGDGAAACSLMEPVLARTAAEAYGGRGGTSYLRGAKTCAAIVLKLFQYFREELAEAIRVVEVRVQGSRAQAVLASRKMRASSIFLSRQAGGLWRIQQLLGLPLP